MPTEELNIERFEGVIQTFGDAVLPGGAVKWAYGVIDDGDVLSRIGGKMCLASSMKPFAQVIDVHHLPFEDNDFVLVHHASSRELFDSGDLETEVASVDGITEYALGDHRTE